MPAATHRESESNAQFAEDRILEAIFASRDHGYCVEVGANDGRTGSASYLFEKKGWDCLLVEPIPALVEEIKRHRNCAVVNCAASSQEGEATFFVAENVEGMSTLDLSPDRLQWIERVGGKVKQITVRTARLDTLLDDAGIPEVHFITIDVEGHELEVLQGLSLDRYKPRVVIVENNSLNADSSLQHDSGVTRYMAEHGYVHFRRTGVNEWYARADDLDLAQPDQIRRFARAKKVQEWEVKRRRMVNRIATRVGAHLPAAPKHRLRALFEGVSRATGRRTDD